MGKVFQRLGVVMNYVYSVVKSAGYTMTTADEHVLVDTSATITFLAIADLIAAGVPNKKFIVEVSGGAVVATIACDAADTLDDTLTSMTLTGDGNFLTFEADIISNNWVITAVNPYLSQRFLQDGAVTTEKLADDAITGAKIAAGAVDTVELAADAVTGAKIEDDAVDTEHIAALAVETAQIAVGAVDTAQLAADAVDGTKIEDDAVDNEHIAALAVDTAQLEANSVKTAKIADANITGAKMSLGLQHAHVSKATSSTDPQTFDSIAIEATISEVTSISEDTTASNITVKNGTDTVCTFASGIKASGMAGAFTLANTTIPAAGPLTVESDATNGDAYVTVHFEAAG